jgi:hypothetical protein
VAIRRNGTVREHRAAGDRERPPVCPGSGLPAVETRLATCIGCGCDDLHACVIERPSEDLIERDADGSFLAVPAREVAQSQGCHWLRVDYAERLGVCSACPQFVTAWDAGEPGGSR